MSNDPSIAAALSQMQELQRLGKWDAAEASCRRLVQQSPQLAETWLQLGLLLLHRQRWAEAEGALQQAAARGPQMVTVWDALGIALREQGKPREAEVCARQAIALAGELATPWLNLGSALYGQLRWEEAAAAFRRSVELDPANAAAWSNLGAAEQVQNHLAAAEHAYQRCLALGSRDLVTLGNYSLVLASRGNAQQARDLVQSVPETAVCGSNEWVVLGNVYKELSDFDRAAAAYRRALAISAAHPQAIQNLALVLESQAHYAEAGQYVERILADNPSSAEGWSLLAGIKHAQGEHQAAIAASERSLSIEPHPVRFSRMLQFLQYADDVEPSSLLAAHQQWDAAYGRPLFPTNPPAITRPATTKLRLGFVSNDFGTHPIAFLTLPVLESLDKNQCEVFCYSDRLVEDDYTARFRAAANVWRKTCGWSDPQLADQIRLDQIDVLFDLAGHHGKRLLVFARKPAALQVSWAGYVGTTGLQAMDCILADRFHIRDGEEQLYVESVLRMPNGYICYGPPTDAPDVGPLPAASAGRVMFGCFNNPGKYSAQIFDAWAEILRRVADAQLLLKFRGLDESHNRVRISQSLAARGIDSSRIVMEGWVPHRELLATYNRVDLALDTQPYSGGLTTCEAIWMGVPVITFPGRTFAGRHSTSHLSNAGLPEFVAADVKGYVESAVQWTGHLNQLAALRARMRHRVRQSPLCDAGRFAFDFLKIVRQRCESRVGGTGDS